MGVYNTAFHYGWVPALSATDTGPTTKACNSATTYIAQAYIPTTSKTLNKVRWYLSSVVGTLATTDLQCDIYSDVPGDPNASLANTSTISNASVVGSEWIEFTGFSLALTAGTRYWIVVRNLNATPATNYPVWYWPDTSFKGIFPMLGGEDNSRYIGITAAYTTTGTSWTNSGDKIIPSYRLAFSDSTYEGLPLVTYGPASASFGSTTEMGAFFSLPSNVDGIKVIGIQMWILTTGSPSALYYKLYSASSKTIATGGGSATITNVATSQAASNGPSGGMVTAYFSSPISLSSATSNYWLVTGSSPSSNGTTNAYNLVQATWDTDTNSLPLCPSNGGFATQGNLFKYQSGAGWSSVDSSVPTTTFFNLILDSTNPFTGSIPTTRRYYDCRGLV